MPNVPLHPAIVHLPLGLAIVMPIVAAALTAALFRGWLPKRAWAVVVGLQALVVVTSFGAMNTGEQEEERVERVVSEQLIEEHEEAAKAFLGGAIATLVLAGMALAMKKESVSRGLAVATTALTLGVAGLGMHAGKEGGALVYQHGAARAYVPAQVTPNMLPPSARPLTPHADHPPHGDHDD